MAVRVGMNAVFAGRRDEDAKAGIAGNMAVVYDGDGIVGRGPRCFRSLHRDPIAGSANLAVVGHFDNACPVGHHTNTMMIAIAGAAGDDRSGGGIQDRDDAAAGALVPGIVVLREDAVPRSVTVTIAP